jgi:DNA-directed RNA polymerase specialized sigma24 family protein
MKTLEARAWDKMLQLEHRKDTDIDDGTFSNQDVPNMNGGLIDVDGQSWSADLSMIKKSLDLSSITPAWVQKSTDKLFAKMTIRERHLIYLYYVQELSWKQISETLDLSINQVQKLHDDILCFLKGKFGA